MVIQIREADFDADYAALRRIRFDVFVEEQNVPESLEMDDRDPHCVHVLAFVDGEAVGTGRIDLKQGGKVGRLAVLAAARKLGVGSALMHRLHEVAAASGLSSVWCNAQVAAVAFYRRLGYEVVSEPFLEAGIEHVKMGRRIAPPTR